MRRQPSLRNFAVTRKLLVRPWGSVWAASDRRNGSIYWLVRPSRLVCWPRIMASLSQRTPFAVRLRNNRVAIVVPDVGNPKLLAKSIKQSLRQRANFNAFKGFTEIRKSRWNAITVAFASFIVLIFCSTLLTTEKVEPGKKLTKSSCASQNLIGLEIQSSQLRSKTIKLQGQNFSIGSKESFGGMIEITAQRICDEKLYLLRLWSAGDHYIVSEVN